MRIVRNAETLEPMEYVFKAEEIEEINDIVDSENSGLSHQDRLNEVMKIIKPKLCSTVDLKKFGEIERTNLNHSAC